MLLHSQLAPWPVSLSQAIPGIFVCLRHAKVGADHSLDVVGLQVGWCRLLELRDKFVSHVSHDWFWRASPAHGPVVRPAEFTMVVQLWIFPEFGG